MSVKSGFSTAEAMVIVYLKCGKDNNYHNWRKVNAEKCIEKFGSIATVMKTQIAYVVPPIHVEDYNPEGDETTLTAAEISTLKTDQMKFRMKLVRELKLVHPQFYSALIQLLSPESRDLIERHEDFAVNDLVGDANKLWEIIKSTHLTNTTGGGEMSVLFNKVTMRKDFDLNCMQGKSSTIVFKEHFVSSWKTLLANGEGVKS